MKNTNPITEEVKKVAEETGAQVENVAEGVIPKDKMEAMDSVLNTGADGHSESSWRCHSEGSKAACHQRELLHRQGKPIPSASFQRNHG